MKKALTVIAVVLVSLICASFLFFLVQGKDIRCLVETCDPLTEVVEFYDSSEDIIEGQWSSECDVLEFNRYAWQSTISFDHAEMIVKISFTDIDIGYDNRRLAFIILSPDPDYHYEWLYTRPDGSFNFENTRFDESRFMDSYPGGYPAFEQELKNLGIDWAKMYSKAKAEFLLLYIAYERPCGTPKQQIDSESA